MTTRTRADGYGKRLTGAGRGPGLPGEPGGPDTWVEDDGEPILLRVEEAARRVRLSRAALYIANQRGELRTARWGRAVRIPLAALREWVATLSEGDGSPGRIAAGS
jgi:excisionase family DNA binding protein